MVSVPAYEPAGPSLNLGIFSSVKSRNVKNENVQDIRSVQRRGELGLMSVNHERFQDILAVANLELFPCI